MKICGFIAGLHSKADRLFGIEVSMFDCHPRGPGFDSRLYIVVSMFDCHPRGPGFDSRLYPRNFSGSLGSGMGSTQPREDNWVAT